MINDLIQTMRDLQQQSCPPVAIAASCRVIDFLKRSPLFIEKNGQTAMMPSVMPKLIPLKNASMFGLGDG